MFRNAGILKFRRRGITKKKSIQHSEHSESLKSKIQSVNAGRVYTGMWLFPSHLFEISIQPYFKTAQILY